MLLLLLFALYLTDFVYKYRSVNESSYCFISRPLPCIDYHLPFTQDWSTHSHLLMRLMAYAIYVFIIFTHHFLQVDSFFLPLALGVSYLVPPPLESLSFPLHSNHNSSWGEILPLDDILHLSVVKSTEDTGQSNLWGFCLTVWRFDDDDSDLVFFVMLDLYELYTFSLQDMI